jgi:hypothetical protein
MDIVLCENCAKTIPWQWREATERYSVDGCEWCEDGMAGHRVYVVTDQNDTRPHIIVRRPVVGDVVLYHTDDTFDPMRWDPSPVVSIDREAQWTFSGPVKHKETVSLACGRTIPLGVVKVQP